MDATRIIAAARKYFLARPQSLSRRPTDVIFLLAASITFAVTTLIFLITRGYFDIAGFSLFETIRNLPTPAGRFLQLIPAAGGPGAVLAGGLLAILARRYLLARNLAASGLLAWLFAKLVRVLTERGQPEGLLEEIRRLNPTVSELAFPSGHVAVASALVTVATPYLNRKLQALLWSVVALVALARLYEGSHLPIDVIGGVALGVGVGALTNLLLGVRQEDSPVALVQQTLEEYGVDVCDITPVRGSTGEWLSYFVKIASGDEYFVKLIGTEQRNANFLFKVWRAAFLKSVASVAPFLTPKQQAEHEAYLTLLAQGHGVRTPDIEFSAKTEGNFALIARKRIPGRPLDTLDANDIGDALLREVWLQVQNLHGACIVHGDLHTPNIVVDGEDRPWIIDFGLAEAGAAEEVLIQDIAHLLASLATIVGPKRAVATALDVLGQEALLRAVPGLQPAALSVGAAVDLQMDPDLLATLQEAIAEQTGEEIPEDESILRIRTEHALWVFGLGLGIYFLLPQLGELGEIAALWRSVHSVWLLAGLVASAATYALSAITLVGAVTGSINFWRTFAATLAASFGNRFSPRGVGGVVILERYLERTGLNRRRALTAVAVKTAADVIIHTGALIVTLWAIEFDEVAILQDIQPWQIVIGVGVVILLLVFFLRSPARVRDALRTTKASLRDLRAVFRKPTKAAQLFGGTLAMTFAYIATLLISLLAVGVQIPIPQVAAVYFVGELIGSASPTPGGLGVLEGTYIAALTALGVSPSQAVAAVLLYRLLTFWLPILPGFLAFRHLQREEYL